MPCASLFPIPNAWLLFVSFISSSKADLFDLPAHPGKQLAFLDWLLERIRLLSWFDQTSQVRLVSQFLPMLIFHKENGVLIGPSVRKHVMVRLALVSDS